MKIFILEDDRNRIHLMLDALGASHDVQVSESCADAKIKYDPPYDLTLLDHDLGGRQFVDGEDPETGYQFVKFMVSNGMDPGGYVIVHSYNPDGAKAMQGLLEESDWNMARVPFGLKVLEFLKGLPDEHEERP